MSIFLLICLFMALHQTALAKKSCKAKSAKESEIEDILKYHNEFRQRIALGKEDGQPSASNMRKMQWEDGLAKAATKSAEKCEFEHDDVPTGGKYDSYGQNLYEYKASKKNKERYQKAISSWYDEMKYPGFNSKGIKHYDNTLSPGTGHYTQLIWAKSYEVGCARCTCEDENSSMKIKEIVYCNYGPAGNVLGEKVYKKGEACSKCGQKWRCSTSVEGLCTKD